MNPEETADLIERVGGDTEFGRLLGIDSGPFWRQRVNNWKRRGIPASVLVEHYDVIAKLRKKCLSRDTA